MLNKNINISLGSRDEPALAAIFFFLSSDVMGGHGYIYIYRVRRGRVTAIVYSLLYFFIILWCDLSPVLSRTTLLAPLLNRGLSLS